MRVHVHGKRCSERSETSAGPPAGRGARLVSNALIVMELLLRIVIWHVS